MNVVLNKFSYSCLKHFCCPPPPCGQLGHRKIEISLIHWYTLYNTHAAIRWEEDIISEIFWSINMKYEICSYKEISPCMKRGKEFLNVTFVHMHILKEILSSLEYSIPYNWKFIFKFQVLKKAIFRKFCQFANVKQEGTCFQEKHTVLSLMQFIKRIM